MGSITDNINAAFEEGVTFVFGSWICIAHGMGGFSRHLAGSKGPLPNSATSFEAPHDLVEKLNDLKITNPNVTQRHHHLHKNRRHRHSTRVYLGLAGGERSCGAQQKKGTMRGSLSGCAEQFGSIGDTVARRT
jgi:hypothetical protein